LVDRAGTATYGEIVAETQRLVAGLRALGIGRRACVIVQAPNWRETLVVHLALEALGAIAVPLPPNFREKEVAYIARLVKAVAVVVAPSFGNYDLVAMYRALEVPSLRHVIAIGGPEDSGPDFVPYTSLLTHGAVDDLASDPNVVMELGFTSGSTGEPKGTVHTSNSLMFEHRTWAAAHGLGRDDVFFVPSTIGHQLGYSVMRAGLILGGKVVFLDRWDAEKATRLLRDEHVSFLITTPAFLFDVLRSETLRELGGLPALRVWVLAGQVVTSELDRASAETLPHVKFARQFGMTEIGSMIVNPMTGPAEKAAATGRLQPGAEMRVVDPELRDVPTDTCGELMLKAPSLFLGYFGRPELQQSCFTDGGFFRTGDEVKIDADGWVWVTGRIKDLIKRGGESVAPAEIEDLLSGHPKLLDASVVGVPDERLGEKVCVFVVVRGGESVSLEEITAHLGAAGLARPKWPELLFTIDALPRTAIGKVHKATLRQIAIERLAS